MEQAVYSAAEPCPLAGAYTVLLPPDADNPEAPLGYGGLALTISATGKVAAAGKLADGSAVAASSMLSRDGNAALYISLYAGGGSAFGWLNIADAHVSGLVSWIKPETQTGAYPAGFATAMESAGNLFDKTQPALPAASLLILTGATLADPIKVTLQVSDSGKITATTNNARVSVASNGLFAGAVIDPTTHQKLKFRGAIDQSTQSARGWFQAGGESGDVYIGEPKD